MQEGRFERRLCAACVPSTGLGRLHRPGQLHNVQLRTLSALPCLRCRAIVRRPKSRAPPALRAAYVLWRCRAASWARQAQK